MAALPGLIQLRRFYDTHRLYLAANEYVALRLNPREAELHATASSLDSR